MRKLFILAVVVALALLSGPRVDAQQGVQLTSIIAQYGKGDFEAPVRQIAAVEDLGPIRLKFVQDVPTWIAADPAQSSVRRNAAAAFLLELTYARLETDWGRLSDLIEFTCANLRTSGPATPFELAWDRASMALTGRARARLWLLGEYATLPHQPVRKRPPPQKNEPPRYPMHLKHALERFPQDPQLRLDQVTAWAWGRDQEMVRNNGDRNFGIPDEYNPFKPSPQLREAVIAYETLVDDPAVGAEALVRIGNAYFAVGDYPKSLEVLKRAQQRDAPPSIRYLSFFIAGRALEALKRPSEAMIAYADALEIVPGAESASVALSSLHVINDENDAALALIEKATTSRTQTDPGRLVGYGSFMQWPALLKAMREELAK